MRRPTPRPDSRSSASSVDSLVARRRRHGLWNRRRREWPVVSGVALNVTSPRVALLPGSIRADSVHGRLAAALVPLLAARDLDAAVIDLADYPMPLYHGDDEAEHGQPAAAVALHDQLAEFDGLILVSPEYNGGPSALLKNAIDWVTRVDRAVLKPLLVGLAAASPGPRGGLNGLSVMRSIVQHLRLDIVGDDLSIASYGDAFELVDGVPALVRGHDIAAADLFVGGYAARLHERVGVESSRSAR